MSCDKAVLSPDARRAVFCGPVWIVRDLLTQTDLGPQHSKDWPLRGLAFNPSGSRLLILSEERTEVWDPQELKPIARLSPLLDERPRAARVCLSPDGATIADWDDRSIRLWHIGEGRRTEMLPDLPAGRITATTFDPDGQHLIVVTDAAVNRYDLTAKQSTLFLPVPGVRELTFSSDGQQVLTLDANGVTLWDVGLRRPRGLPLGRLTGVRHAQFRPDGLQILTIGDREAWLWPNPIAKGIASDYPTPSIARSNAARTSAGANLGRGDCRRGTDRSR